MSSRVGQQIKMASIDELLGAPDMDGSIEIDIRAIYPFENHPFRVVDDEKMDDLVESIKLNGILTPVLVRPDDKGTYEMVSGHRRLHAARRAGLLKIPALVRELTTAEATILMVDANIQREEILPSEKAFALKMKMDAIKHQGKKLSNTLSTQWTMKRSGDIVGETEGIAKSQVHKYIRLTELIPALLEMVDKKRLALSVAVELSYLSKTLQQWSFEYIYQKGMIKQEQLMELRKYRDKEDLTREQFLTVLDESMAYIKRDPKVTLSGRKLSKFFPAYYSRDEMEGIIFELLAKWKIENGV